MWSKIPLPWMGRGRGGVKSGVARAVAHHPHPTLPHRGGGLTILALLLLAGCRAEPTAPRFPNANRDVAPIVGDTFSTEDARDRVGEAEEVMDLAELKPGMSVADVGAGEGYYTVRLSPAVGRKGRVLAEDIVAEVRDSLSDRV